MFVAISVTILKLDRVENLEDASRKLLAGSRLDVRPDRVEWPINDYLQRRWRGHDNQPLGVNEITSGTEETFRYIYVNAFVERAKRVVKDDQGNFLNRPDRVNTITADALFFEHNNSVYCGLYISNRGTKLNTIMKDLFKEEIWGNITVLPTDYHILDDTYYWILNKFLSGNRIISENPFMRVETFTGYTGTSSDEAHSMTGEGERISAMLGTLAFIFSNDPFKSLKLHITFDEERLLFNLASNGYVEIIENDYDGRFCIGTDDQIKILLTLLIYKKVIPHIGETYQQALDSDEWSTEKRTEFIRETGNGIIDRVQRELDELDLNL